VVTLEAPQKLETSTKSKNKKVVGKKNPTRGRPKKLQSPEEFKSLTTEVKESEPMAKSKVSPSKQGNDKVYIPAGSLLKKSPRLLNRSKSCYTDRPGTTKTDLPDKFSPAKSDASGRLAATFLSPSGTLRSRAGEESAHLQQGYLCRDGTL